jgi:hypothetical protein
MDKSRILSIKNINELIFEVKDDPKLRIEVTNIADRQCTCEKWQHTLLPCTQAICAHNFEGLIFMNIVLYNIMFKPTLKLMVLLWKEYLTHTSYKPILKDKIFCYHP